MIAWMAAAFAAEDGMPVGPASVALWDGALGRARSIRPRTAIDLAPRGLVLVDTPAFYGQIVAGVAVEASVAPDPRTGLWLRLEPLRYQNVIGAIPSDFLGYGFTTIGLVRRLDDGGDTAFAFASELVLPSAIGLYGSSWPFGLDLALAFDREDGPLAVHGQLGYLLSAAAGRGPSQLRTGLSATLGGVWRPGRAFGVVLDLQSTVGYAAVLDHLAVAPGLRFGAGSWGLEIATAVPLFGRERALAALELHSSVRF
jgi:hypothetical protein